MTRDEKKAKDRWEYVSERLCNSDYPIYNEEHELESAFDAGAEWADAHPHWISVKDRKPKLKHSEDNMKYSDTVIVTNGKFRTSARWLYSTWGGWYGWYDDGDEELKGITHWMHMPQPPSSSGIPNYLKKGE